MSGYIEREQCAAKRDIAPDDNRPKLVPCILPFLARNELVASAFA